MVRCGFFGNSGEMTETWVCQGSRYAIYPSKTHTLPLRTKKGSATKIHPLTSEALREFSTRQTQKRGYVRGVAAKTPGECELTLRYTYVRREDIASGLYDHAWKA
ncbi:hypothetical protein M405DRAFT_407104 [Rhizopogon salebrosus TDB-379]|nr:hypothetical protein M405DRAFT_407104 [Rhizopogon salebrosus TDB-379]